MAKMRVATGKRKTMALVEDAAKNNDETGTVDGGMAELMRYMLACSDRRPPVSVAEYQERVIEYFERSVACGCTPGKPGLAVALGYADLGAMADTCEGQHDTDGALVHYHKIALNTIHQITQEQTVRGRIGSLFLCKASFGMSDQAKPSSVFLPSINISLSIGANNHPPSSVTIELPNTYAQLEPIKQE